MTLIVGHGEAEPAIIMDAITSIRRPLCIVTMHELWWEVAAEWRVPRLWFNDKLRLMRFVLGKKAVAAIALDNREETISMYASMETMNVPIFRVAA